MTIMIGIVSAAFGPAAAQVPTGYDTPKYIAPEDAPSSLIVAGSDEPGERLIVTGEVTDGNTPLARASIYVFQTDAKGRYTPDEPHDDHNARLHGAMRSDAAGRYRYETVRPGSYGGPAHIHYVVNAPGYKTRMVDLWFADDPKLAERRQAGQPEIPARAPAGTIEIRPLSRDAQGVWYSTRDIVLERN